MSFNNVVPGNNWETPYSDYTPYATSITNINNSQQAVVTVVETPPYTIGEIVSFRVSRPYGMFEVNNVQAKVLAVSGNDITVDLDTLGLNPFVYPPVGEVVYPALVIPAGSGVIPGLYTPTVNLEDNFDNAPAD